MLRRFYGRTTIRLIDLSYCWDRYSVSKGESRGHQQSRPLSLYGWRRASRRQQCGRSDRSTRKNINIFSYQYNYIDIYYLRQTGYSALRAAIRALSVRVKSRHLADECVTLNAFK